MTTLYWIARFFTGRIFAVALFLIVSAGRAAEPFQLRGYYITFMRMPVMGLAEWKQSVDCFAEDGVNVVVLWMAGGFGSKKFPITWQYNVEHHNVTNDFARELIDYAHTKNIRVLLGFTPYGYDGVNRYSIEHPDLKAKKADGSPVDEFGIHCWGWNLCPSRTESQRFMREYISEMCFEFYSNADGLLIESSDYNICRCADCGPKYYDREFAFVKWISNEFWKRKSDALILVYPHYFTGKPVPGLDTVAARQEFDSRWGLFFTPHSAHFDDALIKKARASVFWSDAPILGTPLKVITAAREAREHGVTGFMPSLEAYSYVARHVEGGEPSMVGKRQRPFGLDALGSGRSPYTNILAHLQRAVVRDYSLEPELNYYKWQENIAAEFFGKASATNAMHDLLDLQSDLVFHSEWTVPSPLLDRDVYKNRVVDKSVPKDTIAEYFRRFFEMQRIATEYENSANPGKQQMGQTAREFLNHIGWRTPNSRPAPYGF